MWAISTLGLHLVVCSIVFNHDDPNLALAIRSSSFEELLSIFASPLIYRHTLHKKWTYPCITVYAARNLLPFARVTQNILTQFFMNDRNCFCEYLIRRPLQIGP